MTINSDSLLGEVCPEPLPVDLLGISAVRVGASGLSDVPSLVPLLVLSEAGPCGGSGVHRPQCSRHTVAVVPAVLVPAGALAFQDVLDTEKPGVRRQHRDNVGTKGNILL